MLRYALIIVAFIALMVYVLILGMRGTISGRFRIVSIVLLGVLVIMVGTGLYYNMSHYSVQSVEEDFSSNRSSIMEEIRTLYEDGRYEQARQLSEKFIQINDPELNRLYRQSREAELLARIDALEKDELETRRDLYRKLERLTSKQSYARKVRETTALIDQKREKAILAILDTLPPQAFAQRALGYRKLQDINPDKVLYKQELDAYILKIDSLVQSSPWNDVCSSKSLTQCDHAGFRGRTPSTVQEDTSQETQLEILGVTLRPKGTRISKDGRVAPEDGTYYLVHEVPGGRVFLSNVNYLNVFDPFAQRQ